MSWDGERQATVVIVPDEGVAAQEPSKNDENNHSTFYSLSDYTETPNIICGDDPSVFESINQSPTHKAPPTPSGEIEMTEYPQHSSPPPSSPSPSSSSSPPVKKHTSSSSHLCIVARGVSRSFYTTSHKVNYYNVFTALTACCQRKEKREFYMLRDMSTVIAPSEMVLVISPPGGGKSSYLKALGSRMPLTTGKVYYNGIPSDQTMQKGCDINKRIQYMTQTEHLVDLLTVQETLEFAHKLGSVTYNPSRIDEVLSILTLYHCRDTKVGRLSGGEKKRLSLGEALLTDSNVLLLDEYTSGLSASDSRRITQSLHDWCKSTGKSIVASIVQPTQELVQLYDRIVLLSHGMTVFDGTPQQLFPYFSKLGYPCPADTPDPYAFILDCVSDNSNNVAMTMLAKHHQKQQHQDITTPTSTASVIDRLASSPTTPLEFSDAFRSSVLYEALMTRVDAVLRGYGVPVSDDPRGADSSPSSSIPSPQRPATAQHTIQPYPSAKHLISPQTSPVYGSQYRHQGYFIFKEVFIRLWRVSMRNKAIILTRVFNAILTGIIFGTMYYQTNHEEMSIFNRVAVTAISIAQFSFFNLVEMPSATNFGVVLYKELRAGLYPSWTFVISAFLSSIPRGLLEVVIFTPLIYFLSGFALEVSRFFTYFGLAVVACFFHSILFRFFSTVSTDPTIAQAFAAPFTVFGIILSGLFATEFSIPVFLRWLYWVFPYSYFVRAVLITELGSEHYNIPYDSTQTMGEALMGHLDLRGDTYYIGICVVYAFGLSLIIALLHIWYLNTYNFEDHRGSVRVQHPQACLAPTSIDFDSMGDSSPLLAYDRNSITLYRPHSTNSTQGNMVAPQHAHLADPSGPILSTAYSLTYHSRRSGLPSTAEATVEVEHDGEGHIIYAGDSQSDRNSGSHNSRHGSGTDSARHSTQGLLDASHRRGSGSGKGSTPPTLAATPLSVHSSDGSENALALPALHTFSSEIDVTRVKKPSSRATTAVMPMITPPTTPRHAESSSSIHRTNSSPKQHHSPIAAHDAPHSSIPPQPTSPVSSRSFTDSTHQSNYKINLTHDPGYTAGGGAGGGATSSNPGSGLTDGTNALQLRHSQALSALPFPSITLSFANIQYSVRVHGSDKQILHDVSAFARPNELMAVLGVSGAGKSTLLDVVSFRKNSGTSSGKVYFNDVEATPTLMAQFAGYVEQFESLFPFYTVRESLLFSARLRLPYDTPEDTIQQVVDETLIVLDLHDIQDQLIGEHNNSGLSISQMKRINIGLELVSNPSVLFLDEPTTGLDCVAARNIIQVLQRVAATGRTVVATIHNPSTDVFLLFDRLLLLGAGKVIYFGDIGYRAEKLVHYMTSQPGIVPIQDHENPATWLIDQVGKGSMTVDEDKMDKDDLEAYRASLSRAQSLQPQSSMSQSQIDLSRTSSAVTLKSGKPVVYKNVHVNELHESYKASNMSYVCNQLIYSTTGFDPSTGSHDGAIHAGHLAPPVQHSSLPSTPRSSTGTHHGAAARLSHLEPPVLIASEPSVSYGTQTTPKHQDTQQQQSGSQTLPPQLRGAGYLRQFTPRLGPVSSASRLLYRFYLVLARHWMAYYRNPPFLYIRVFFVFFMAMLFGLLYLGLPLDDVSSLISTMSAIILGAVFSSLIHASTALPVILSTKRIALHEQHAKMYPIFFWVLSTILVEVVWCFVGMLFTIPSYFMLDLLIDINLFYYMILSYFNSLAYLAFIIFVAVISPNDRVAAVLSGLMYAYLTNFTGISLRVTDMSKFYFFLYSICPSGYLSESLILGQFQNNSSLVTVPIRGGDINVPINLFITLFTGWDYGRTGTCMGYILLIALVLVSASALLATFIPKQKR